MRRPISLPLVCAVLGVLVAPGMATAAAGPTAVPGRFLAAAERDGGRGACAHVARGMREHLALLRVLLQEDVYTRDAWTADGVVAGCDRVVGTFARAAGPRRADGRRVVVDRVRVVARRGDVVHLRMRRRAAGERSGRGAAQLTDTFLMREQGRWRIAVLGRLLVFDDDGPPARPLTFADFDRHQRVLARVVRERRTRIDRAIADRERARTPLVATAPACAGPVSEVSDAPGDVLDRDLRPAGATGGIDVIGATLQGGPGELCLTVRFSGPVPASAGVALEVRQPDGGIDARETGGSGGTLHADIENGHVTGWAEPFTFFAGVHATVAGDLLHLRFPARAADDAITHAADPFLWIATVTADTGLPRPDWLPSDRTDLVGAGPNGSFGGPGGGVRHPPG